MPPIAKKRPSPASLFKHILAVVVFLVAAGCSGGGCSSGCSSCGGITPLTNGFDVTKRIENAGSARVTPHGLKFLQSNLGTLAKGLLGGMGTNGVITFDVPTQTGLPLGITLCPNGSDATSDPKVCVAEIDIGNANLTLTPTTPNDLVITGTLPLRVEDLVLGGVLDCTLGVSISGNGACDKPDAQTTFDAFPVDVDIQIHVDSTTSHTARYGYTRIDIPQIINTTTANSNLSSSLNICGSGLLCGILGDILNDISGVLINTLTTQLTSTLSSTIDNELCQKAAAGAPCPTGTTADSSMICRFNNDPNNACASILLGTDGNINLGSLLASLSPGTTGGLDFVFAGGGSDPNPGTSNPTLAWGDLDPIKGGATLGLFGGAEPNPLSKCVPMSSLALPTGIPIPDELLAATATPDTVPNWPATLPGPDVGIALNERFANYALNGLYNSGLLCIGISTESIPLLSSGTLGLLAPSSKKLSLQENPQQVAIVIRPSTPPTVTFGNGTNLTTDPLLKVGLKQVALDFYIFSLDRFIRFMTATFDLTVPVNLTVSSAGLTPVIQNIGVANGVVTNSQLLSENPSDLATALGSLIGSIVGQEVGGSLSAINLNSSLASLGLTLTIPDTVPNMGSPGLIKLSKGTDNFLGIFATFGLPGQPPGMFRTNVQVARKTVDPAGLKLETLRPGNQPVVELVAESELDDGTRNVVYQYKVDKGFWHPYQASRFLTVDDDWLRVQGRHVVHVRSRALGAPNSVDAAEAELEVVIDKDPPTVKVAEGADGQIHVEAHDRVTADPIVRYRLDDKPWSDWTLASRLGAIAPSEAAVISVQAQDSEGNLGTASQALVRGRFDGTVASACGSCNVGSNAPPRGSALFLLGVALAGIGARLFGRKPRPAPRPVAKGDAPEPPAPARHALRRRVARKAFTAVGLVAAAGSWSGCSCGKSDVKVGGTTTSSGCPSCVALDPGLIGEYSSVAVSSTDIWVAGYSEADWDNGNSYGDLVVGKWDGTKVNWSQVDGVPSTPAVDCTVYDCTGFRGGQTAPGDDVGLWTSIAIGADGNPAVAYLDNTNQALKFAQYNGSTWTVQTVDTVTGGIAGRYAKMIFLNGNFVIAYQTIAPGGTNGALISKVRVATSGGGTPASGAWTFEDAATVDTTPCRASFCTATQACLSTTKQCTTTLAGSMCTPSCASGTVCVTSGSAPACVAAWDDTKIDAYPDAIGDYITLAPDGQGGFGIAYYDRTNGDLRIASKSGGTWTTMLVDGESAPANGGDSGIGASLFIDTAGDWHLAYVNGYSEALQYVKVTKGTTVGTPEIVDNGLSVGGTANTDGQHLVGDDAHIVVLPSGEVHITYADSTVGTLHYAVGTPGSTGHLWNVAAVTQDGFAGLFSSIVVASNQTQLMNWWRTGGAMGTAGDVRLVTPPM
jgi:hypothetical protein